MSRSGAPKSARVIPEIARRYPAHSGKRAPFDPDGKRLQG
jgi:hypothetical protein